MRIRVYDILLDNKSPSLESSVFENEQIYHVVSNKLFRVAKLANKIMV